MIQCQVPSITTMVCAETVQRLRSSFLSNSLTAFFPFLWSTRFPLAIIPKLGPANGWNLFDQDSQQTSRRHTCFIRETCIGLRLVLCRHVRQLACRWPAVKWNFCQELDGFVAQVPAYWAKVKTQQKTLAAVSVWLCQRVSGEHERSHDQYTNR